MTTASTLPPGIRSVTLKGGKQRFVARVHLAGMPEYNQRFETVQEAVRWRTQVATMLEAGIDISPLLRKTQRRQNREQVKSSAENSTQDGLTVREAINAYLTFRSKSHTPLPSNKVSELGQVSEHLGGLKVASLRNHDLVNYVTLLLKTPVKRDAKKTEGPIRLYKEATTRRFIYALKVALEWNAKNRGVHLNEFLFRFEKGMLPAAWAGARTRRLVEGEEEKLYAAGLSRGTITYNRQDWENVIGFALETAMREQEIVLARWEHILGDGSRLHIPAKHSKTRTARTVLLSKRARDIVASQKALRPKDAKRIFHQFPRPEALCQSFARLTARAGIEDLHFHDLRHEATSRLCESGKLNQMAIMEMTGHSSMQTFKAYVHLIRDGHSTRLD